MSHADKDIEERFSTKYAIDPATGCWVWTAYRYNGYGRFGLRHGKIVRAHRVSYEWHIGPIPVWMVIDHVCRNRACVNPAHLRVVTRRENNLVNSDGPPAINAMKTHCPRGHLLTGDNLLFSQKE